jgi:hypothetical protein
MYMLQPFAKRMAVPADFRLIRKFGLSEISFEISSHRKLLRLYNGTSKILTYCTTFTSCIYDFVPS